MKPLAQATAHSHPAHIADQRWYVACDVARINQHAPVGTQCYLIEANPEHGVQRARVFYRHTRGFARLYIAATALEHWHATPHAPERIREECMSWPTRAGALAFASALAKLRDASLALCARTDRTFGAG